MVLICIDDLEMNFPPVGGEITVNLDETDRKTTKIPQEAKSMETQDSSPNTQFSMETDLKTR